MKLRPVIREEDDELLGFVGNIGDTNQWQAFTVFKFPLQVFPTEQEAEAKIQSIGLDILMDKWYFFDSELAAWFGCQIVEASPEKVKYRITEMSHPRVYQMEIIVAPSINNFKLKL
ncbi:MAG: hypothetical protein ACKVOQ_15985 [Cyclobacteriaceae bacterium]